MLTTSATNHPQPLFTPTVTCIKPADPVPYTKALSNMLSNSDLPGSVCLNIKLLDVMQHALDTHPAVELSTKEAGQRKSKRRKIDTAQSEILTSKQTEEVACPRPEYNNAGPSSLTCENICLLSPHMQYSCADIPSASGSVQPTVPQLGRQESYDWLPWVSVSSPTDNNSILEMEESDIVEIKSRTRRVQFGDVKALPTYGKEYDRTSITQTQSPDTVPSSLTIYSELMSFKINEMGVHPMSIRYNNYQLRNISAQQRTAQLALLELLIHST